MKLKTNKSIAKRFRVTKNDKNLHRATGQDHFNARATGKINVNKRRMRLMSNNYSKVIKTVIN